GCRIGRRRDPAPPRTRPRWRPCSRVISSAIALASPWRRTPSTMPSSVHSMVAVRPLFATWKLVSERLRFGPLLSWKLQSHGAVAFRIVSPAFAHLHKQKQMHRLLDDLGDFAPRIGTDGLDGATAFAEQDFTLAFAFDKDRLFDPNRPVFALLPLIGLDSRLIRQFLVQAQVELFARDFRSQMPQW